MPIAATPDQARAIKVHLFDPSWHFWAATREPIDAVHEDRSRDLSRSAVAALRAAHARN